MYPTSSDVIARLVRVTELVALQDCEGIQHGQPPCPKQYDDDEDWCIVCLAKQAYKDYCDEL